MTDYKKMYMTLYRDTAKAIDTLQQAQQKTEQLYMESEDEPIKFKMLEGKRNKKKLEPSRDDRR